MTGYELGGSWLSKQHIPGEYLSRQRRHHGYPSEEQQGVRGNAEAEGEGVAVRGRVISLRQELTPDR